MHLRYPEGFRSTIDAALTLRGNPSAAGARRQRRSIKDGVYAEAVRAERRHLRAGVRRRRWPAVRRAADTPRRCRLRFDIKIQAPGTLRLENNLARIVSRADLTLNGTYDSPVIFGRADIERGEIFFEGNRYRITRGTIDFLNPSRIQPFFDHRGGSAHPRRWPTSDQRDRQRAGDLSRHRRVVRHARRPDELRGQLRSAAARRSTSISLMFGQTSAADLAIPSCAACAPRPRRSRKSSC